MPEGIRERFSPFFSALGKTIARLIPWPSVFTIMGFLFAIIAAYLLALGWFIPGGLLILLSGFMDAIDGAVARAVNKVSKKGAFLDSNFDRLAELAIYFGIGMFKLEYMPLCILALGLSLLVSYSRAKIEGLSNDRPHGLEIGERAERLGVLIIFVLIGYITIGLYIIIAIAAITYAERLFIYYRAL